MNSCNRSCILAENLNRISTFTLPTIPVNVSVISVEHEVRRKAKIIWMMRIPHNYADGEHIEYIIEARAHIGNSFSKHKLGQWFNLQVENIQIESLHSHNFKYVLLVVVCFEQQIKKHKTTFFIIFLDYLVGLHCWLDDSMNFELQRSMKMVREAILRQLYFN